MYIHNLNIVKVMLTLAKYPKNYKSHGAPRNVMTGTSWKGNKMSQDSFHDPYPPRVYIKPNNNTTHCRKSLNNYYYH